VSASDSFGRESSRRVTDSAGKASGHLLMAEQHLQDVVDVLASMPTAGEQYESGASRYVVELVERVRQGRVQVIEIGEQLVAKYQRWEG
jgi:hypothetical protein